MNPSYQIYEQIDKYLRKELSGAELTEFDAKLSSDEELRDLVESQRVANRVIVDRELFNLKQRMVQDFNDGKLPSSTNWPGIIGIVSLVVLTSSILVYKFSDNAEPEIIKKEIRSDLTTAPLTNEQSVRGRIASEVANSNVETSSITSDKVKVSSVVKEIFPSDLSQTELKVNNSQPIGTNTGLVGLPNKDSKSADNFIREEVVKSIDCGSVKISAETKVYYQISEHEATIIIDKLSLKGGKAPYSFAIDDNEFSTNGTFSSLSDGNYRIRIKDNNNCISVLPENVIVKIPAKEIDDVFAPDRDEKWKFPIQDNANANIKIISKVGVTVYTANITSGYPGEWNGRDNNGNELDSGDYFFIIQFTNNEILKGHISIVK